MGHGVSNEVAVLSREPDRLAFKAYEIEELADVYFFRPLGMLVARLARALRMTPTAVTVVAMVAGVAGGALLYNQRLGYLAFGLIIFHSVLDSADGQLARMTGRTSELGRLLDGIAGYVTHAAIYLAILASVLAEGGGRAVIAWALAAALANVIHAQMYDYHRASYIRVVIDGLGIRPPSVPVQLSQQPPSGTFLVSTYESMQARLAGLHPRVESALAIRARDGTIRSTDRERYRQVFYPLVRGWNLMGDNTRFYAIGALVWLGRLDLFFGFVLVPMTLACTGLWLWQARADRRFLAGL